MASLYDTYATSSPTSTSRSRRVGHSPTRTSRLRNSIVKLSCYLNGEADRSRATVVHLPEECDTLGEVIPKIHHSDNVHSIMMLVTNKNEVEDLRGQMSKIGNLINVDIAEFRRIVQKVKKGENEARVLCSAEVQTVVRW